MRLAWWRKAPESGPVEALTPAEQQALRTQEVCRFCGGWHLGYCPRLTGEVELYESGAVKRITLRDRWDTSRTVWPWQIEE